MQGARASAVTIIAHDIGPVGGMERVLSELILGLHELGHEITVIARTCDLPPDAVRRFHRVPGPSRPFLIAYPWFLIVVTLLLWRWRRGVVQATGGIVLAPVDIVSVHYCHQVGPASPSRAGALFRANIALVRVFKRVAERACFLANRRARFVCVSEGVAEELRAHYPRLAPCVMTIHNGVDTERFQPGRERARAEQIRSELEIPPGRLQVVFVGGEWARKGLRYAIEALAHAPEWDLLVAGDGDEQRYRELARSLGVEGAVRFLGVRGDVAALYELADAFVMPTAYETFSLVTYEAAASGLPILATAVNGISELLEEGVNGHVIEPSGTDIARRLRGLAADPAARAALGGAARRSAMRFTWQRTIAAHHDLYEQISGFQRTADCAGG